MRFISIQASQIFLSEKKTKLPNKVYLLESEIKYGTEKRAYDIFARAIHLQYYNELEDIYSSHVPHYSLSVVRLNDVLNSLRLELASYGPN